MNRYNDYSFEDRSAKAKAHHGGFLESLIYETKPFIFLAMAAIAYKNHYADAGIAKLSVGLLFAAASYIIYCRLVYRGYLK